jgi:hypothetical protein
MSRELLKRALSKLLVLSNTDIRNQETDELIEEIEQMLSKTLPEPVGYCFGKYCGGIVWSSTPPDERKSWLPLYAEPPSRKPLTDDDIEAVYDKWNLENHKLGSLDGMDSFARAIEAKIREQSKPQSNAI